VKPDRFNRIASTSILLLFVLSLINSPLIARAYDGLRKHRVANGSEAVVAYDTAITCDGIKSTVHSVCSEMHGEVCASQTWLVGTQHIELKYDIFEVASWACLPSKFGYKIIFNLVNLGRCDDCEGHEIWNPDGSHPSGFLYNGDFDAADKQYGFPITQIGDYQDIKRMKSSKVLHE
jgi:hypothetical protein